MNTRASEFCDELDFLRRLEPMIAGTPNILDWVELLECDRRECFDVEGAGGNRYCCSRGGYELGKGIDMVEGRLCARVGCPAKVLPATLWMLWDSLASRCYVTE